jgi:hypothetical protein
VYCIKFCTEYFIRVLKLVSKYISTPRFAHSCLTGSEKKRETLIGCTNFYSFGIIDTEEHVSKLIIDRYYWSHPEWLYVTLTELEFWDVFGCNRGDTIQDHSGLQTRKFGQAAIMLFLNPRQALSSHLRQQIVWLYWLQDRDSMPNWYTINHPTTMHTHNETQWPTAARQWHFALWEVSCRQSCHFSTPSHPRIPPVHTAKVYYIEGYTIKFLKFRKWS